MKSFRICDLRVDETSTEWTLTDESTGKELARGTQEEVAERLRHEMEVAE